MNTWLQGVFANLDFVFSPMFGQLSKSLHLSGQGESKKLSLAEAVRIVGGAGSTAPQTPVDGCRKGAFLLLNAHPDRSERNTFQTHSRWFVWLSEMDRRDIAAEG